MITLPLLDDLHVHLRQGDMMQAVVPCISEGGVGRVLVMPNLSPPITTVELAIEYRKKLTEINPNCEYFMTLFLNRGLLENLDSLDNARQAGVVGIKSYPKGVTTGSDSGVESYDVYYPIFSRMEQVGLSLHFHGEVPNTCVMKAEEQFIENLFIIHEKFPRLKIVLEHVTTAAAIEAVKKCGPTVAATITVHHLDLTISDVVGNNVNFCKPVAKFESDRDAIRSVVREGNGKFFLGSDSAPHSAKSKSTHCCAPAGIFTQPLIAQYLADAFDRLGCLEHLEKFACETGSIFLGLPPRERDTKVTIVPEPCVVPDKFVVGEDDYVIPYRAGQVLKYSIKGI
jgi:dihydroorotase